MFKIQNKIIIHHSKYWFRKESLPDAKSRRNLDKDLDNCIILSCSLTNCLVFA